MEGSRLLDAQQARCKYNASVMQHAQMHCGNFCLLRSQNSYVTFNSLAQKTCVLLAVEPKGLYVLRAQQAYTSCLWCKVLRGIVTAAACWTATTHELSRCTWAQKHCLVLALQPKEGYEMEPPEKLEEAKQRQDAGNQLFKQARSATYRDFLAGFACVW